MKKVKIMLTAVVILGTVGGVLAYKVKRSWLICTAIPVSGTCSTNGQPIPCQGGITGKTTASTAASLRCTTLRIVGGDCINMKCPNLSRTTVE